MVLGEPRDPAFVLVLTQNPAVHLLRVTSPGMLVDAHAEPPLDVELANAAASAEPAAQKPEEPPVEEDGTSGSSTSPEGQETPPAARARLRNKFLQARAARLMASMHARQRFPSQKVVATRSNLVKQTARFLGQKVASKSNLVGQTALISLRMGKTPPAAPASATPTLKTIASFRWPMPLR